MRVIIVEGLDNTGKTTTINSLKDHFVGQRVEIIHCQKPEGSTPKEQADFQNRFFLSIVEDIIKKKNDDAVDAVILDRAWYGEYVYGQLYRQHDPLDIVANVMACEENLHYHFKEDEISFIFLSVSDPAFSVKHDDGLSISDGKIERIEKEKELFEVIFDLSKIKNKICCIVNNELQFRSRGEIMKDIMTVIK